MAQGMMTHGRRVWSGDLTTVAEAHERFQSDPERYLIEYAVALYSFRSRKECAKELLDLRASLLERARQSLQLTPLGSQEVVHAANEADVLSTHLEWMSRQQGLPREERHELRIIALELCDHGIEISRMLGGREHTPHLLRLTSVRLYMHLKKHHAAHVRLRKVEEGVVHIADAKQRVRVMRKLGFLYRRFAPLTSLYWGFRACFVRGVPMAVRLKSAAALFAPD